MLLADFRRILTSKTMYISIILGLIIILRPFLDTLLFSEFGDGSFSQYLSMPFAQSDFTPFAAIFCVLPFADSYCSDIQTNYINSIVSRTGWKKYSITRAISVLISGGLVMSMIVFVTVLVCLLLSTEADTPENTIFMYKSLWYSSGLMFKFNGLFYILLRIVFAFIFGCVWSSFALFISTFTLNKYAVIILPFVIYEIAWFSLECNKFNPVYMLRCDSEFIPSFSFVFIYQLSLILLFSFVSIIKISRKGNHLS